MKIITLPKPKPNLWNKLSLLEMAPIHGVKKILNQKMTKSKRVKTVQSSKKILHKMCQFFFIINHVECL